MSWKGIRKKGTEILTSREWNLSVDALDELYGMLTDGTATINVDTVLARTGSFSESVNTAVVNAATGNFDEAVFVQGKPVVKDGDPVQIYQFYDVAVSQITKAVDEAKVTEYARETRDVAVRIRMDEYGNIGVVIAEPIDEYGRVAVSAPSELLEEFKSVSSYGSITATENVAGFEVVLEKGGRPNVNIFYSLGGAGEVHIEVSRDGATWRTLKTISLTTAGSGIEVISSIAYPYIRARTPTTGIDAEFEVVASR